ncbi:hypothetical protein [Salinarchaeum laminariae]|uniref:hypothetical protein n=1 Tax=Salinarchaeum laminariae TaxID=869888 RepID=UPI0020C00E26|nr:hypothetical protein [Salinarchaeum laminariae]
MRRRALLTTAAGTVGLAGCVSLSTSDDGNATETGGTNGTDGGTAGDDPQLSEPPDEGGSVIDLETIDRTVALSPTTFRTDDDAGIALWFDRTATEDAPARLTGWLVNQNDYENTFDLEWIPAVGNVDSQPPADYNYENVLRLAPTENNEVAASVPEITRNEHGLWNATDVDPWIEPTVRLDPGEFVELEYVLVGEPGMSDRPTGVYEFAGDDRGVQITLWDTDTPGPEGDSYFEDQTVPPIGEESSIQWYHESDESTEVTLRPETELLELDGAVDFELVYNDRESSGCGHWDLHKLVDGEWFHVGPWTHNSDCRFIAPGERMNWRLRAFNESPVPSVGDELGCAGGLTSGYLGPGTYAVVVGFGYPAGQSGALVELTGDPVAFEPTEDASIEQDGAEIVMTSDAHGDGEHPPDATLTVERSEPADDVDVDRIIPEQVMGDWGVGGSTGLRNALAAFESEVERVVVLTDEHDAEGAVGYEETTRFVEVRGQTYELTAELSESD